MSWDIPSQLEATDLALDNEAAIQLSQNKILTVRTKSRENYVREANAP